MHSVAPSGAPAFEDGSRCSSARRTLAKDSSVQRPGGLARARIVKPPAYAKTPRTRYPGRGRLPFQAGLPTEPRPGDLLGLALALGQTLAMLPLFVRAIQASVCLGEQVSSKVFGDDTGSSEFAEVGNGELGKITQDRGERGSRMPDQ